jgi:hypothetical protein
LIFISGTLAAEQCFAHLPFTMVLKWFHPIVSRSFSQIYVPLMLFWWVFFETVLSHAWFSSGFPFNIYIYISYSIIFHGSLENEHPRYPFNDPLNIFHTVSFNGLVPPKILWRDSEATVCRSWFHPGIWLIFCGMAMSLALTETSLWANGRKTSCTSW